MITNHDPLPDPAFMSYVTDSVMRSIECKSYTADQMREYSAAVLEDERNRLVALVANDAWAMTFQTMGQYRSALVAAIRNQPKKNTDGESRHGSPAGMAAQG